MAVFAERLKEAMEHLSLKQVDVIRMSEPVGEKYGIKIGKSHISQYLSGKTEPRTDIIKVLAETLEVNQLWLQGEDVPMMKSVSVKRIGEDGMREFLKSTKLDNVLYDVRGPVVEEANRMEAGGANILKLNIIPKWDEMFP